MSRWSATKLMRYRVTRYQAFAIFLVVLLVYYSLPDCERRLDPFNRPMPRQLSLQVTVDTSRPAVTLEDRPKFSLTPLSEDVEWRDFKTSAPTLLTFTPRASEYMLQQETTNAWSIKTGKLAIRSFKQAPWITDRLMRSFQRMPWKPATLHLSALPEWPGPTGHSANGRPSFVGRALGEFGLPELGAEVVYIEDRTEGEKIVSEVTSVPVGDDARFPMQFRSPVIIRSGNNVSEIFDSWYWNDFGAGPTVFTLKAAASIYGRILKSDGTAAAEVLVAAASKSEELARLTITDSDGRFRMEGLWPDDFEVSLRRRNKLVRLGRHDEYLASLPNTRLSGLPPYRELAAQLLLPIGRIADAMFGPITRQSDFALKPGESRDVANWELGGFVPATEVSLGSGDLVQIDIARTVADEVGDSMTGRIQGRFNGIPGGFQRGIVSVEYEVGGAKRFRNLDAGVSGQFYFDQIPENVPLKLTARSYGTSRSYVAMRNMPHADDAYHTIKLRPEPRLGIEVYEAESGQEILDAYIATTIHPPTGKHPFEFEDEDGRVYTKYPEMEHWYTGDGKYAVTTSELVGRLWVFVAKPGFKPKYVPVDLPTLDEEREILRVELLPGRVAIGKVIDETGSPVPSAEILVQPYPESRFSNEIHFPPKSGADGRFAIDYIGTDSKSYVVKHRDYQPQAFPLPAPPEGNLCILKPTLPLTGVVSLNGATGVLARISSEFMEDTLLKGFSTECLSEVDGSYQLMGLPAGRHKITATFPGFSYSPSQITNEVVIAEGSENRLNLNIVSNR